MENLKNVKIAEFSLKTMSYFGGWRPTFLTSTWAIRLYTLYSIIVLCNNFLFVISFLISLYQNKHKPEAIIRDIIFFTSTFLITLKLAYLNIHRQDVLMLVNLFLQEHYLPCNDEEVVIYKKFQYRERFVTQM